jgi:hypothetical protein
VTGAATTAGPHPGLSLIASFFFACSLEPGYKAELRAFESELTDQRTVACIQAWLPNRPSAVKLDEYQWPGCLQPLQPLRVTSTDDGAVAVTAQRGEVFTLVVYPPGRRPERETHEPSTQRPGYLGTFGPDAYIGMTER